MAPWARLPGCVLACDAQIGRGRPRVFCDQPIRRNEGRVVNTPLVFKRVLFQERRGRREETKMERRERETRREKRRKRVGREREEPALDGDKGLVRSLEWKDDERRWR
ncbi:hypothetical protein TNCV_2352981 [Trichonephila clavipes]|nr:hypothetical protein TNCV_2352981 [Trichonephila clavipes]